MSMRDLRLLLSATLLLGVANAGAVVIYDEAADGDLSNDAATPTLINLGLGSNIIKGEVGDSSTDLHDAFELGLSGLELVSIDVLAIVIDSGTTVRFSNCTVGATNCNFTADENVGTSFQESDLGGDLLAELVSAGPSLGFITRFFQLTESEGPSRYELDFVTRATTGVVPEPASLALMALGLAGFGARRHFQKGH